MKYYRILNCDHAVKDPMICVTNLENIGIDKRKFQICKKFDEEKNIKFFAEKAEDDGTPDDFLQNGEMVPIFSPRMRKAIEEAGIEGIQYIPIEVIHYNNEILEGYCIANVLNSVSDALDFDNSVFLDFPCYKGKVKVYTASIYPDKVKNQDIFRLKFDDRFREEYSTFILVSEKFKSVISKNKFTGMGFTKVRAQED